MKKILFAGEGGQGIQAIAEILAKAAYYQGLEATYIPNFGVEQRGGVSLAFVIIDSDPIGYPKFEKGDLMVAFSDRSLERILPHLGPKTILIVMPGMSQKNLPNNIKVIEPKKIIDFPPRFWNMVALGELNRLGSLVEKENLLKSIEERFSRQFKENPRMKEIDLKAVG